MSVTIGELAAEGVLSFSDGYRTKRPEHGRPGFRILRVADVADGSVSPTGDDFVAEAWEGQIGAKLSRPGDVLLTTKGTVGRVAIMPPSRERVVYSPQLCYFRVHDAERLNARWLSYWFKSADFRNQASHRANNTDMAAYINLADIRSLQLPEIALLEQQGIAEVLGALDDKIAANADQADKALVTGDALMARQLGGPQPRVKLGELVSRGALELSDGYRTKRNEHGVPGLRILRAGDVKDHRISPTGADYVSSDFSRQMGRKVSQAGDIILTTKGTVGRVAVVPADMEQVVYSPQICYFRVTESEQINSGYLAAWFRSSDLERQTATVMFKSDMAPYISLSDIRSLTVPMPHPDRQRDVGLQQGALLKLFASKAQENRLLAEMRDALLPQLMSGRIRVEDAERIVEGVV